MTTETEETDELSRHRRIIQTAKNAASLAVEGARLYDELRKEGLSPTAAMTEVAKHVPALHRTKMSKERTMAYLGFSLESIRMGLDDSLSPEEKLARLKELVATEPALSDVKITLTDADGEVIDEIRRVPFEFGAPEPPLKATIKRLFSEAESPLSDQAPALECWILLHGLPTSIHGSLSETPEGELRMLSPAPAPSGRPGAVMMVEQFFCYGDVLSIAVQRAVDVVLDEPRIIRS